MDVDGSNLSRLTNNSSRDNLPAWSPDGTKIVFRSGRDGNSEVFVIDLVARVEMNPEQQSILFQGETALELIADGVWTVAYVPDIPLNPLGYETLRFVFHPGDTQTAAESSFRVTVAGSAVEVLGGAVAEPAIDLGMRDWQVVELSLDRFELPQRIDQIVFSGNLAGTFYLDDIRFVTAWSKPVTAIEEEVVSGLPREFALDQNYPNPFNSGTVIRFALPNSEQIELAIYNLVGQKVATLVQGWRAAGSYTVKWDGRDDVGRGLASGIYLYRLATDKYTETRKLILLR